MNINQNFNGIQFLRFFAALLVVITHSTLAVSERLYNQQDYWFAGAAGVDIFFIISGFVMSVSTVNFKEYSWRKFLAKRIVRVVPLYWIATALKIIAILLFPFLALHATMDWQYLLASFAFIPAKNADGMLLPILPVGWTLSYEMFFYTIFTFALVFKIHPLKFVTVIFLILASIGIFRASHWPPVTAFASTLLLEFIFGMILANVYSKINIKPIVAFLLILSGMLFILTFDASGIAPELVPKLRFIFWGIPAFLIVAGFVFIENKYGNFVPNITVILGNASYSLYLFHSFVISAVVLIMIKLNVKYAFLMVLIAITSSLLSGFIIHKFFEVPMLRRLRNMFGK